MIVLLVFQTFKSTAPRAENVKCSVRIANATTRANRHVGRAPNPELATMAVAMMLLLLSVRNF